MTGRRPKPETIAPEALGPVIGRGRTCEVHLLNAATVVKLYHDKRARARARREFERTALVRTAGAPAWRVDRLVRVGRRWGLLGERVEGTSLLVRLRRRPFRAFGVIERMAALQAGLAALRPSGLPSAHEEFHRAVRSARLPDDVEGAVLRLLATLPDGAALCHGDLHPGNVVDRDGRLVVLDWHNCAAGDPASDVVRTCFLLQEIGAPWGLSGAGGRVLAARFRTLRDGDAGAREPFARWSAVVLAARLARRVDPDRAALLARLRRALAQLPAES